MAGKSKCVRLQKGGMITIPVEFRRELGIESETLLEITLDHAELRITPLNVAPAGKGSQWFKDLYDYFAPVRDEIAAAGHSEDEINADIDAAIRAVRAEHG
jgi:bifunctional DNA-binding transcriptional regulator/antitoxin component of YhaV-PrlF toxin-antitoxin module